MIWLTLSPINTNYAIRNVIRVINLFQVNDMWLLMILEEIITYVEIILALHQMLYIYMVFCRKCKKQSVGFKILWKPRLCNYKSHIKKHVCSCQITAHFIDKCCDEEIPFKYLAFFIIDVVNKTPSLACNQVGDLLLGKKFFFWTGTLETQHHRLNIGHDWNHSKGTEREKLNN